VRCVESPHSFEQCDAFGPLSLTWQPSLWLDPLWELVVLAVASPARIGDAERSRLHEPEDFGCASVHVHHCV